MYRTITIIKIDTRSSIDRNKHPVGYHILLRYKSALWGHCGLKKNLVLNVGNIMDCKRKKNLNVG